MSFSRARFDDIITRVSDDGKHEINEKTREEMDEDDERSSTPCYEDNVSEREVRSNDKLKGCLIELLLMRFYNL